LVCAETSSPLESEAQLPKATDPSVVICPACQSQPVSRIHLLGLSIEGLAQAVDCKRAEVGKHAEAGDNSNGKRTRDYDASFELVQAESSFLLASHSHSKQGGLTLNDELKRTGRWTDEETAFVDFILESFDNGKLPLQQGVKLIEFLGDLLLCKSSRLTKKMKNAKLSVRSYTLKSHVIGSPPLHNELMSTLQEQFLQSIISEAARLELRFHMTKVWRTYFSNLCLQVSCNMLDASEWNSSLESMDHRAAQAEENIRSTRRRQMGIKRLTDVKIEQDGESPDSSKRIKPDQTPSFGKTAAGDTFSSSRAISTTGFSAGQSVISSEGSSGEDIIAKMFDPHATNPNHHLPEANEDLKNLIRDWAEDATHRPHTHHAVRNHCGPFLDEIVSYIELNDLPFEHVDVWAPLFSPTGQGETSELRLFYAGHATRGDLDPALFSQMQEYGEYSVNCNFASGAGLPGRVYASGEPSWECQINEADPKTFARAGSAKVYGIKTGLGIPLTTRIGRIVVSMYSALDSKKDDAIIQKVKTDLALYSPEPKWKLVVDIGPSKLKEVLSATELLASSSLSKAEDAVHSDSINGVGALLHTPIVPPDSAQRSSSREHSELLEKSPPATSGETQVLAPQDDAQRIATLLGDYMPLSESATLRGSTSHSDSTEDSLAGHFMSLRLLILRSSSNRSPQENEMLDVIQRSFTGYSNGKHRSDRELAFLIAKEWHYLQVMMEPKKSMADISWVEDQSRALESPAASNCASAGGPAVMPISIA
jgi:hypothetical protein